MQYEWDTKLKVSELISKKSLSISAPEHNPWRVEAKIEKRESYVVVVRVFCAVEAVYTANVYFKIPHRENDRSIRKRMVCSSKSEKVDAIFTYPLRLLRKITNFRFNGEAYIQIVLRSDVEETRPIVPLRDFSIRTSRTDCVLLLGKKEVHVEKTILDGKSEYFKVAPCTVVNGRKTIQLNNRTTYEDFNLLLNHIYYPFMYSVTSENINALFKSSREFKVVSVKEKIADYSMKKFTLMANLVFADSCDYDELTKKCLASCTSGQMKEIKEDSRFAKFSPRMYDKIMNRRLEIAQTSGINNQRRNFV